MPKRSRSTIEKFIAMSDADKERVVREIDVENPQRRLARSRPLNARERAQWNRFKAKGGRPTVGKGAKTISLTVERELLEQADAYAKEHGISRAALVARGLQTILGSAA